MYTKFSCAFLVAVISCGASAGGLCSAKESLGISFSDATPRGGKLVERTAAGVEFFLYKNASQAEPFYRLTVAVTPASKRVWQVEARYPIAAGQDYKSTIAELQKQVNSSGGITYDENGTGTGGGVIVEFSRGIDFVTFVCKNEEAANENVKEAFAAMRQCPSNATCNSAFVDFNNRM